MWEGPKMGEGQVFGVSGYGQVCNTLFLFVPLYMYFSVVLAFGLLFFNHK